MDALNGDYYSYMRRQPYCSELSRMSLSAQQTRLNVKSDAKKDKRMAIAGNKGPTYISKRLKDLPGEGDS